MTSKKTNLTGPESEKTRKMARQTGAWLRYIRTSRDCSLDDTAARLGISKASMSKYERGELLFPQKYMPSFCSLFDTEFHDEMDVDFVRSVLVELITAVYYRNTKREKEIMEYFFSMDENLENSAGFLLYLLADSFHEIWQTHNGSAQLCDRLEKYFFFFNEDQTAFANLILYRHYFESEQYVKAHVYICKALESVSSSSIPYLKSLVSFYYMQSMIMTGNSDKAAILLQKTKEMLLRDDNYDRFLVVALMECLNLSHLGRTEHVRLKINRLLQNPFSSEANSHLKEHLYKIMIENEIRAHQYQLALEWVQKTKAEFDVSMEFEEYICLFLLEDLPDHSDYAERLSRKLPYAQRELIAVTRLIQNRQPSLQKWQQCWNRELKDGNRKHLQVLIHLREAELKQNNDYAGLHSFYGSLASFLSSDLTEESLFSV